MARITEIELVGKKYPMSFSLMASKLLAKKYGSVEKALEFNKKKGTTYEDLEMIAYIVALLISQGCAYKNYFEKDVPVPEDAPVIDGKWTALPQEAVEIAMQLTDMEDVAKKIEDCVKGGKEKEVTAKVNEKNMEAGQEE